VTGSLLTGVFATTGNPGLPGVRAVSVLAAAAPAAAGTSALLLVLRLLVGLRRTPEAEVVGIDVTEH